MTDFLILKSYYNKEGINDGAVFEIVDDNFNHVSYHKTERLANRKLHSLKQQARINNVGAS